MAEQSKSLRELLVKSGLLTEDQVKLAIEAGRSSGETLVKSLLKKNLIDEAIMISFLEKEMEIPRVDLSTYLIDPKTIALVPLATAKKYQLIPLFKVGNVLTVAISDPFDVIALDEVREKSHCDVEPMVATARDIEQAIAQHYGLSGSVDDLVKTIEPKGQEDQHIAGPSEDAPVTKLVSLFITKAVEEKASDIHIEPTVQYVRVRYRVDGVLHDSSTAPSYLLSPIVNRIKVMGKMDISKSRVAQDGRFELKVEGRVVDVRVSTFPTIYGECIVMRLLDKSAVLYKLKEIGFSDYNFGLYEKLINRPHGIILVTGPTGSGKTTTLYATLNHILSPEENIMTVEDPVEYELPGIRQSQVNTKAGFDFANALPYILRQDPDVVLVGEIRDVDTARMAIQAALTGHLVFATLHTNDAAGSLNRLIYMGVESYLIASAVAGAVAQRLVRTICPRCKEPYNPTKEVLKELGLDINKQYTFYRGKGCKFCHDSGFHGRSSIFEILTVNEQIQNMIVQKASSNDVKQLAVANGMKLMRTDGLEKALAGETTIEEVIRVTELD
ncbi:hypothetical protein A2311_00560 [candidate division WOR-1 bacterium RIFOXYB2_FULL_48_7]|uniref:Bacterial type II secretion system protein E domain-containing protein n=1 Tax=candidate division WOR-1 bacterium RIFOXYB2_FULL_48_7 TaxID=1802583 RepID=A0A1F4TSL6_UNCSA|nr:MAG: hypothetical protein A2311_00560 [candidate division WOR-1 bacterium RIFOXYB2_FULL_48_7]